MPDCFTCAYKSIEKKYGIIPGTAYVCKFPLNSFKEYSENSSKSKSYPQCTKNKSCPYYKEETSSTLIYISIFILSLGVLWLILK